MPQKWLKVPIWIYVQSVMSVELSHSNEVFLYFKFRIILNGELQAHSPIMFRDKDFSRMNLPMHNKLILKLD